MEQTLNSNSSLSDNNQTLQLDENLYSSVSMNQRPPTSTRIRSSVSLVNNEEVISTFMKSESNLTLYKSLINLIRIYILCIFRTCKRR